MAMVSHNTASSATPRFRSPDLAVMKTFLFFSSLVLATLSIQIQRKRSITVFKTIYRGGDGLCLLLLRALLSSKIKRHSFRELTSARVPVRHPARLLIHLSFTEVGKAAAL